MQIVLHTGLHFTDEGKLLGSLAKNREVLAERGISLPKPSSYRNRLRDLLNDGDVVHGSETRDGFVLGLKDKHVQSPDRIVLSNDNFFCVPRLALRDNTYYPDAEEKLQDFCNLFHGLDIEVCLAVRNTATFVPSLLSCVPEGSAQDMLSGLVPTALRWSEMVRRLREALPNVALTVWCNEDTPIIWEQLMREMAGVEPTLHLDGGDDLLSEIMSSEGLRRYSEYLKSHPTMTEVQKRRVIAAFLDKFGLEDELEEELEVPGWNEEYIDALTDIYDEDVYEISRVPGITLVTP
ncbi:hypothetical protein [Shimia sediminis]|uniref:hypothetical protein n=1 Tax=Shimia sediminis TaxID=2497945 RepID=UPI000F8DAD08|nr:hypothetical protein [Shimia sediminis]